MAQKKSSGKKKPPIRKLMLEDGEVRVYRSRILDAAAHPKKYKLPVTCANARVYMDFAEKWAKRLNLAESYRRYWVLKAVCVLLGQESWL